MLDRMDSAELSEWLAFDHAFNLPDGFYEASTVAMAIYRAFAGAKVTPGDFAPIFAQPSREQTPSEAAAIIEAFAKAHNARIKHGS